MSLSSRAFALLNASGNGVPSGAICYLIALLNATKQLPVDARPWPPNTLHQKTTAGLLQRNEQMLAESFAPLNPASLESLVQVMSQHLSQRAQQQKRSLSNSTSSSAPGTDPAQLDTVVAVDVMELTSLITTVALFGSTNPSVIFPSFTAGIGKDSGPSSFAPPRGATDCLQKFLDAVAALALFVVSDTLAATSPSSSSSAAAPTAVRQDDLKLFLDAVVQTVQQSSRPQHHADDFDEDFQTATTSHSNSSLDGRRLSEHLPRHVPNALLDTTTLLRGFASGSPLPPGASGSVGAASSTIANSSSRLVTFEDFRDSILPKLIDEKQGWNLWQLLASFDATRRARKQSKSAALKRLEAFSNSTSLGESQRSASPRRAPSSLHTLRRAASPHSTDSTHSSSAVDESKNIDEAFQLLDSSESGSLTLDAVYEFCQSFPVPPQPNAVRRLFHLVDVNASNDIDRAEFEQLCQLLQQRTNLTVQDMCKFYNDAMYRRLFELADESNDGSVSREETRTMMEAISPLLGMSFTGADVVRLTRHLTDDLMSFEQFKKLIRTLIVGKSISKVVAAFEEVQRRRRLTKRKALEMFEAPSPNVANRSGGHRASFVDTMNTNQVLDASLRNQSSSAIPNRRPVSPSRMAAHTNAKSLPQIPAPQPVKSICAECTVHEQTIKQLQIENEKLKELLARSESQADSARQANEWMQQSVQFWQSQSRSIPSAVSTALNVETASGGPLRIYSVLASVEPVAVQTAVSRSSTTVPHTLFSSARGVTESGALPFQDREAYCSITLPTSVSRIQAAQRDLEGLWGSGRVTSLLDESWDRSLQLQQSVQRFLALFDISQVHHNSSGHAEPPSLTQIEAALSDIQLHLAASSTTLIRRSQMQSQTKGESHPSSQPNSRTASTLQWEEGVGGPAMDAGAAEDAGDVTVGDATLLLRLVHEKTAEVVSLRNQLFAELSPLCIHAQLDGRGTGGTSSLSTTSSSLRKTTSMRRGASPETSAAALPTATTTTTTSSLMSLCSSFEVATQSLSRCAAALAWVSVSDRGGASAVALTSSSPAAEVENIAQQLLHIKPYQYRTFARLVRGQDSSDASHHHSSSSPNSTTMPLPALMVSALHSLLPLAPTVALCEDLNNVFSLAKANTFGGWMSLVQTQLDPTLIAWSTEAALRIPVTTRDKAVSVNLMPLQVPPVSLAAAVGADGSPSPRGNARGTADSSAASPDAFLFRPQDGLVQMQSPEPRVRLRRERPKDVREHIDRLLQEISAPGNPNRLHFPPNFSRVDPNTNVFSFGTKRVELQAVDRLITVKVGGGYLSLEEFCERYGSIEERKVARARSPSATRREGSATRVGGGLWTPRVATYTPRR